MGFSTAARFVAILALLGPSKGIPQYPLVKPGCPRFCPANYAPVCGSDGKTYSNNCALNVAAACEDPTIAKVSDGVCQDGPKPDCSDVCPLNYDPVCGSNGQTYGNDCALEAAACRDPSITKVSDGECNSRKPDCPQFCPANYAPVCGSNGQTYGNDCELGVAACEDPTISKVSDGECQGPVEPECPQICPFIYDPVCASNGQTYSNECQLDVAACEDPTITKVSDGRCY